MNTLRTTPRLNLGLCEDYLTSSNVWKKLDNLEQHLAPALHEDWTTEFSRIVREDLDSFQSSDLPAATRDQVRFGVANQALDFMSRKAPAGGPAKSLSNLAYGAACEGSGQAVMDDCLKTLEHTSNSANQNQLVASKTLEWMGRSPTAARQRLADDAARELCGSSESYAHGVGVNAVSSPTCYLKGEPFSQAVAPALTRLLEHQAHLPAPSSAPATQAELEARAKQGDELARTALKTSSTYGRFPEVSGPVAAQLQARALELSGPARPALIEYARTALQATAQEDFRRVELDILHSPALKDDEVSRAVDRSGLYLMSDQGARSFLGQALDRLAGGQPAKTAVARLGTEAAAAMPSPFEARLVGHAALDELSFDPYGMSYWPWGHSAERKISHLAQEAMDKTTGFAGGGARSHAEAVKIQQQALAEIATVAAGKV